MLHHRHVDADAGRSAPADWLRYHHPAGQAIRDDVAYNQSESRPLKHVTDLMLRCLVAGSGPGQLLLAAADGRGQFEVRIPNHGGAIRLLHGGRLVAAVESGAVAGVQFHPERSGAAGARFLANALSWSRSA